MKICPSRRLVTLLAAASLTAPTLAEDATEPPVATKEGAEPPAIRVVQLRDPLSTETIHAILLGQLALRNGQWSQAAAAFEQAVQGAPDDPSLFELWAQAALLAGNATQFERVLLLWQWRFPDDPRLRAIEAHRHQVKERFLAQLTEQIATVLKNHPESLEQNLLGLPGALAELGNRDLVQRLIDEVTAPYRESPAALLIISEAARQTWQLERAWQAVQQAVALRPDWPIAWVQWAQVALDRFAADEALPALEAAARRLPKERSVAIALAMVLAESRHPERAMGVLAQALANQPGDEALLDLIARLGSQGIAPEKADRLLASASNTPQVRLYRARLWLARQQPHRALALLAGFRPPEPLAAETTQLRIQALAQLGQLEAALALLEQLPENNEVQASIQAARLASEAGRFAQARAILDDALQRLGDEPALLYEYSLVLERLGQRSLAEGYLRKLLALQPFDVHAINALGYLLADANHELAEAERLILLARQLRPNDGFILDSEGWLRFRQGNLPAARALLEQAWRSAPDREIGQHLIAVYQAQGEAALAAQWQARLTRQFPPIKGRDHKPNEKGTK
jgi:tetratricopeptide (TPR) repeat protein